MSADAFLSTARIMLKDEARKKLQADMKGIQTKIIEHENALRLLNLEAASKVEDFVAQYGAVTPVGQ
jgi:hypothetical protein